MIAGCAVALVLLMDVSPSVEPRDWDRQVAGHAAAFRAPAVQRAIARDGLAVAVLQFDAHQHLVLDWRVLRSAADADALAGDIAAMHRQGWSGTWTGSAIVSALRLLERAPCGDQPIVDLVTDGESNGGVPLESAREAAEAAGVRVNALAVQTAQGAEDPREWLAEHVVTAGGFSLLARNWDEFAAVIRRKIVLEIGAL